MVAYVRRKAIVQPGGAMEHCIRRIATLVVAGLGIGGIGDITSAAPKEQKAIVQTGLGGPEVLKYQTIPVNQPGSGEVLVRVVAASVNPGDWQMRSGTITAGPPGATLPGGSSPGASASDASVSASIPGADFSGVIEAVGADVKSLQPGDAVIGITDPLIKKPGQLNGAYAQYVVASASLVVAKPKNLTYAEAAGLANTGVMALRQISLAKISQGQRVVIIGAAGGIGSLAVQMAKSRGAQVIAVASGRHAEFLKGLGADQHVDYNQDRWSQKVQNVDAVVSTVMGGIAADDLKAVKKGGSVVTILTPLAQDACATAGVTCVGAVPRDNEAYLPQVAKLADEGRLKVKVSKTYPLAEAGKAQEDSRAGHTQGKIILIVDAAMADKKR